MQSTAVGIFPTVDRAEAAYRELLDAGVDRGDISVLAREELRRGELVDAERREPGGSGAGVGMGAGAAVGGLGGLLVGLGLLAIPGVGPVLAAGPIAAALAGAGLGAVGGAFVGALADLGMSDDEAQQFAEAVRRGGILLSARVDEGTLDRVVEIMERNGAIDVAEKVKEWRSDELAREREGLAAPPRARGARCVYVYRVTERRRIA